MNFVNKKPHIGWRNLAVYLVSKKPCRIHLSIEKISREFRREGKQGSREVRRVVVPHHNTRRARLDARSSSYTRGHSWSRALAFHAVASS